MLQVIIKNQKFLIENWGKLGSLNIFIVAGIFTNVLNKPRY